MKTGLIMALLEQAKVNEHTFLQEGLTMENMIEFQAAKKIEELYNVLVRLDDQIGFNKPFGENEGFTFEDTSLINEAMIEAKRLLEE